MYVQLNIAARSCNHCCREKSLSITYSECVFVALGIQHACAVLYCHMWPIRLYNNFPRYLICAMIF